MSLKNNKKGFMVISIILAMISFMILIFTFLALSQSSDDVNDIGNTQLRLMHAKELEQDMFFFLDEAIRLSVDEAISEVDDLGLGCDVMVYSVINDCEIEFNETFEETFKTIFRGKLANYPIPYLRQNSFNFYFDGYSVDVESQRPISIPIYPFLNDYRVDNFPFSVEDSYTNRDGFEQYFGFYGGNRIKSPNHIVFFNVNGFDSVDDYIDNYKLGQGVEVYNYLIFEQEIISLIDRDRLPSNIDCSDSNYADCDNVTDEMITVGVDTDSFDLSKINELVTVINRSYDNFNVSNEDTFLDARELDDSFEEFEKLEDIRRVYR